MPLFNSHSIVRSVQQTFAAAINRVRQHQMPLLQQLAAVFTLPATTRRHFSTHRRGISAAVKAFESLESRVLLAAYAGSGTTMTLTLNSNDTVTVVSTGSNTYTFTLSSGSWSGSGTTTGMSASGTTLTANATAKSTFSDFVITKASATTGTDVIFANSASTYTDNFTVTQTGTGLADIVRFNGSTSFASGSTLTVTTNTDIEFTSGAVVQSVNGNISMTANSAGTSTGTFVGLSMNTATLKTTGTGNISLTAKGGATYTAGSSNNGLWIIDSLIQTVSGSITINGTGGNTNTAPDTMTCAGMEFVRSSVKSTSAGNITLTGTGGSGASNTGDCDGIGLEESVTITTTGAGQISMTGNAKNRGQGISSWDNSFTLATKNVITAGSGGLTINATSERSTAVAVGGADYAEIIFSAIAGPISITASSTRGDALYMDYQSIGSSSTTSITIVASGGTTLAQQQADVDGAIFDNVYMQASGAVSLTATGGNYDGSADGHGIDAYALDIIAGSIAVSGTCIGNAKAVWMGTCYLSATGDVTLTGTNSPNMSVASSGDNDGVFFNVGTLSSGGILSITGTAKAGGEGVDLADCAVSAASVSVLGNSDNSDAVLLNVTLTTSGNVSITGTCSGGTGDNDGVVLSSSDLDIGGDATISGTAKDGGEAIQMGTTTLNAAFLQMTATSVNSDSLDFSATTINADGIDMTASRSALFVNSSITSSSGLSVTANNTATAAGTFTGITVTNSTLSSQASGILSLTGKGGTTTVTVGGNEGIATFGTSVIQSQSGSITLTGTAGSYNGTDTNVTVAGVNLNTTTVRSTAGGNISISGVGATGAANNGDCDGVNFEQLCTVSTTGAGSISISGSAKGSGEGIDIADNTNNRVIAGSGGLILSGTAPNSLGVDLAGSGNTWLLLDAVGGPIIILPTSGTDDAITLRDAQLGSGTVTNLTINATGGSVTASGDDDGIYIINIATSITGTLSLSGTAGDTGEGLELFNSTLSAATVFITASTGNSDVLNIDGTTLTATGSITMSATCTGGTGDNDGIIFGTSAINAGTTMSLTGVAKDTGEAVQLTSSTLSAAAFQSNGTGVNSNGFEMSGGSISAATVTITATTASGSANAARAVNSAAITATGSSGLTVNTTGGLNGLQMETSAALRATIGPVSVTADKNISITTGTITSDGVGSISLTANAFGWSGIGAAVNAGTGTVTLATTTSNWPIVLGAADTGSAVGLDSAELSIITAGTLLIGTTANTQPITISSPVSAATAGNLTLRSSGGIAPTASGTDITLGSGKSLSFPASTSILIAVSGNTADTGYSQLNVAGTLNLTGTMLSLSGSYVPVSGDILTVASATSVSGTFTGLANNAVTSLNSEPLLVNYSAGTATLTAYVAPVVTTHPVSTGVTAGTVVSFTAAATGVPAPTVQWQVSTNNGSSWSNISGETSGTYTFTAAAGDTGKQYRAVFTNAEGSANTNAATLLVGTLPVFSSRNVMAAGEGVSTGLYIAATASPTPTFSVSAGTLPAGLTLDPVTGLLSGTPAAGTAGGSSQNYSVTILASNGIGSGTTQNLTITITTGIIAFDVSKGLSQRSYIRYVDLTLANAATASAIVSSGSRIRLTRTDLDGNSPTTVALNGFVSTVGGRIALDFGTVGIGNARNTSLADGYYTLAVDLDNDGQREAEFAFFRLFGDLNGDRQVNSTDLAIANNGVRSAYSAEADANGDGFVTSSDVLYVQRTLNRRLRNGLWLAD